MNRDDKIYEYEYLDDDYKNLREEQLRNFLSEKRVIDYNFLDLQMYNKKPIRRNNA